MEHLELLIFGILLAIPALAVLAGRMGVPYPVTLVVGGAIIGFVPGVPEVELDPDLVLLIFLPPLLYGAAFFTSLRDLRDNARPIALLSVGVVFATMGAVAVLAHHVIGLDWAESFVLGAIVSPTDAVAPAEIMRRVGAPRRLLAVVEGENLTNDWTALVLYRVAVAAVVSGSFSLAEASLQFVLSGVGGLLVGLAVGRVIRWVRSRLDDPPIEITISILSGYAAYLPAEELGLSGVIAAVTVGVYMGWHTPELTTAVMRIQTIAVWEILMFLLNAVLFLLVGLQLPTVLDNISGPHHRRAGALGRAGERGGDRGAAGVAVHRRLPDPRRRPAAAQRERRSTVGQRLVIGWAGMRGAVSLAAALALPVQTDTGAPFPERNLLIFLAFAVIVATLVGQGLTLGPLIRRLGMRGDDGEHEEEVRARLETSAAALARIDELSSEDWVRDDTAERVSGIFRYRQRRFGAQADGDGEGEQYEERTDAYRRLMYELFDAQREALLSLRNQGEIGDEVRRRIERELDLEESRIEP